MTTQITFPTLRSERLVLRAMRESDLEPLTAYLSDFDVTKMLCSAPHPFSPEDGRRYLLQTMESDPNEHVHWAIEAEGQFCGYIKASYLTSQPGIGYWLGKTHWGKGLMSEAVLLVLTYLFQHRDLSAVQTGAFQCNPASLRVLQRFGFIIETLRTNTCAARGGEELNEAFLKVSADRFQQVLEECPLRKKRVLLQ